MSPCGPEFARARALLGTLVSMRLSGAPQSTLEAASSAAFARIARVQALMSAHDERSELTRLNRRAHLEPVTVARETHDVLCLAARLHAATHGLFDPTTGAVLARWGFIPGARRDAPGAGFTDVLLDDEQRVRFARPLHLDLGGIAKGYAVDLAMETLRAHGVGQAVVNAGGDLRVLGEVAEPIHVRAPSDDGRFVCVTTLANAALATSACYWSTRRVGRARVAPQIDPRSGRSCPRAWSVSVQAPTAAVADALTKVVMIGGLETGPWLRAFAATAFVVTRAGDVLCSSEASVA